MEQQFQNRFRFLLGPEQRRAVLEALSSVMPREATLGEVVDAARSLGWSEPMSTLTLQDFADALLCDDEPSTHSPAPQPQVSAKPEPEPQPEPEPEPQPVAKARSKKKVAAKARSSKSAASSLAALKSKLDADEPMSLEEAAEVLVPIVAGMDTATMQSLEEFTGIGRRKLRFHIGQLVRHEYLERHGMGRGTHYTARD